MPSKAVKRKARNEARKEEEEANGEENQERVALIRIALQS